MKTLHAYRSFPLAVRLLLVNQFGVDIGFYLLIPFLVTYLGQDLGLSAALVGLILGVRNLSQQGLFVLGGSAADRLGPRGVIIFGCMLRTVGFALFAVGSTLPLLLAASALSGLAGALFYPAVRTFLAQEAGHRRAEAFALLNVFATAGSLLGLTLGGVLLLVDFRLCALVASGVFAVLCVAQMLALPARRPPRRTTTVRKDWREVLGNRTFIAFAVAMAGMTSLENQVYLLLPEGARAATGREEAASAVLVIGALANMVWQLRVTRALARRGGGPAWITRGIALTAFGFVPPLLVCAAGTPDDWGAAVRNACPVIAGALLVYFGIMIVHPLAMELVPRFGPARLTGTYFGIFYVFSGLAAAGGNALVGWTLDLGRHTGLTVLPWLCCLSLGLISATAVAWLHRTHALPAPDAARVPPQATRHEGATRRRTPRSRPDGPRRCPSPCPLARGRIRATPYVPRHRTTPHPVVRCGGHCCGRCCGGPRTRSVSWWRSMPWRLGLRPGCGYCRAPASARRRM
ncbi:MFS transporter [Streptomyces sp. BG9H]|uniref:MFS transporter n=1 Tax=Streptomyces anatolicus TaxID=2675858 RepID=A0ABS6YJX2_9ACTN|nr:MFS transporter [Streptomyces anatolicus]